MKVIYFLLIPLVSVAFFLFYSNWPQQLPIHYDLYGNIDRIGNKSQMLVVFFILIVISALLFLIHRSNLEFNYPFVIQEENKDMARALTSSFLLLNAILLLLFVLISCLVTQEYVQGYGNFWRLNGLYFIIGILFSSLIIYLIMLKKLNGVGHEE
ncbi:MAG: DUF1648 domain-containing protein [Bacteroidia bacterium]|nr:DUF1648 domain-containing protein [Bacteroidia bacterium]